MSEFVAQIRADLDTSEAEKKLKDLTEKKHELKIDTNIEVDKKSTQKGIDETIEQTKKQTKKKPIEVEVDYKTSKNNISRLTDNANKLFTMFSGVNAIDFGTDKIRDAVGQLKELNTALVEIDKTSNLTQTSLQSLAKNSFGEASKYGAYVQDYLNSAGEFAKAGYSNLDEITETAMLTQIAGNVTADIANKYLIATDAAYKYGGSVKELTKVIDGANNIANKNSVEMEDMAKATTVSASFAAQAGVSVEQLTAAEGTMAAVTKRSGSEMGRAFRSILLNLQQVSGEFDGEVIDEEQLKKVEERCHSLGVELEYLKDGVATLRNPMDILKDLSEVYRSLPDNSADKQGLISDIGGKYHANALSSLLGNWELYEKMLQDYANGSGSAMNEAMKTADSWEGRLRSLSNTWLEFINNFAQADMMKGGITFLDNMISAFDNLQDKQLFIPTMISSIMGLQNLFTGKGITDIGFNKEGKGFLGKLDLQGSIFGIDFTAMSNWKKHFSEAELEIGRWNQEILSSQVSLEDFDSKLVKQNKNFKDYISGVDGATGSLDGYKQYLSATGVEFEKAFSMKSVLANAATGFLMGAGIELSLAAITKIADELIYKQDHLKEKADASATAYSSTVSEIQSINSELATTQARIDELRSQDKLLPTEEAELAQLERQNALLETQVGIKQRLADTQAIEAAEAARESINYTSEKSLDTHMDRNGLELSNSINRKEYVKELVREMEDAKKRINDAQEKLADESISKKNRKLYEGQFESAKKNLETYKKEAAEILAELNVEAENFYDKQTGQVIQGFEDEVKVIDSLNNLVNNFDLSPIEKQVKQIESFFDGSKTSNNLKEQLLEAVKAGESATDALHAMGITLNDLGITGEGKKVAFDNYFEGLIDSVKEAEQVIKSIDGSVDGVKAAFESENKDADWNSMSEYLKQAEEIYTKTGKIGTDDFKAAVQFITPEVINPDGADFKYDADAYVAAWEKARDKVKRYFDSENPINSVNNFTNDIIDKGLASKAGNDITWGFKTSAEAAKALGISIEATEVAMRNLESYGVEFDDVMWSGEGLKRYESALNGIKSIYDSMENSKSKSDLGKLIEGWDNELAGYQADLSTLTEDQIVKIEFEYNIASIQAEIAELQNGIESTGGDTKEWGTLNTKKKTYRDKLASQDDISDATADSGYQKSLEKLSSLSDKLKSEYKSLGEEGRREVQQQQSALLDLQSAYLETFQKGQTVNWEEFLGSKQANEVFDQISKSTGLAKSDLGKLFDIDYSSIEKPQHITLDVEGRFKAGEIESQISQLSAGSTITFTANVEGVKSQIEVLKNEDGTLTYTANVDGVQTQVLPILNQDGTVDYILGESPEEVPNAKGEADFALGAHPKVAPNINGQANYKGSFPTSAPTLYGTVKYSADYSGVKGGGIVNAAVNAGKKASKASKAEGTLLPSYAFGTGFNVLNYKNAYTNGKISLSQDEEALVNELGTESIIRDGKWLLLPGGMHIQALKKGDIVLTAEQTADLLNHGKTNGNARAYANGTLGNAYANGFRLPNAVINNSSSTKKKKKSSSSTSFTTTPSTNTADSISDTNEKAEEFEETLDAIEILINRIERQIKNLERVAGSAFNTFEKRNNALREQMSSITQEISAQQQGYERYLQKANSVELSEDYKNLVRNGAIDISTITDEELSKNIQEFQEWYEKALDCRDAIEELKESVRELYTEAFENVVTLYDGMLNQIDHRRNMLESYIDQTEAQGYIVSTKYYDALISNEQNKLNKLTKERNDLINAMNDAIVNGGIEMYSEQWYEFQEDINSVNEAIQDANTSIIKFKNSIREIKWDIFDKVQDRISAITDEADFLVKVMSDEDMYDDKGVVTKHGTATYGLHGVNYNVFMSQADQYKKEMKAIEKELSKDPYNQTLIERRKELLELQQESIIAAEDEKQAIKSLVEEGIQKQLDALKELIDKYNEALDSQKDLYDYQKNIDKLQKNVDSLEKQWIAYQGDDSEEGSVKRQQTWNDLEEARAELEETQYEKYISDQKKLLDELYTEYETVLNMRLDNLDQLIASVIEGVNAEGSNIRDTLISESEKVGYTLTNSMETIWGSNGPIANILTTYSGNFSSIMTSVQAAINDIKIAIQNAVSASNKNASENISKINKDQTQQTTKPTTVQKPATKPTTTKPATNNTGGDGVPRVGDRVTYTKDRYYYSSDGLNPSGNQMLGQSVYITSINNASWAKKPYHISRGSTLGNGDLGWVSLDQLKGYRTGTPLIDKNQLAWTQEVGGELVLGRSDGAILTPLKRGDAVVNKEGTDQVVEFAKNPKAFIGKSLSELTQEMPITRNEGIGTTVQNDIHMSIGIDHVEGYNDFITQLQKDKQFERMFDIMLGTKLTGGSSLNKYKVRFR